MCGIVGYVGNSNAKDFLVEGLSKLEYRGYDSAGIAVVNKGKVTVVKHKGRLANLEKDLTVIDADGTVGIGHTRWATHGEPSDVNSHPHQSSKGDITVVHNGIIENYLELREWLKGEGYKFFSETDTEVIPNLIDYYYEGDLYKAVVKATKKLEGSYALGVVCGSEPDKLVAVRKDSPLIVGVGEGEYFIASDIPAVINKTRNIYLLEDKEFVVITKSGVEIFDDKNNKINKEIYKVTWNQDAAEKGGFDSFMLKEIHEQPKAIKETMLSRISMDHGITFDDFKLTKEELEAIDRIYIVACGTAYHAGLMGKVVIEKHAKIPVEVDIASEFRYRNPIIDKNTLCIYISQSGETADTIAALKLAKSKGATTLAVSNVIGSSITREADYSIYTHAGPEIAVASTKAYTSQVMLLIILAIYFAEILGSTPSSELTKLKKDIFNLPDKIEEALKSSEEIKNYAKNIYQEKDVFFLGRGIDYNTALEASLKLKEISYIHSEAYAAGELKHGPIALIENGISVISIITDKNLVEKTISNIQEVITRGAKTLVITSQELPSNNIDTIVKIPNTNILLSPIVAIVPLQLLSYYISKEKGLDVDKPRNLAKSVTVE